MLNHQPVELLGPSEDDAEWSAALDDIGEEYKQHYLSNILGWGEKKESPPITRVSQLGKPKFVQAARMPHIRELLKGEGHTAKHLDPIMRRRFHTGHIIEMEVIAYLRAMGFIVSHQQTELTVSYDHQVHGHCDGVLVWGDKSYVFDVKTMSDYSFKKYTAKTKAPTDHAGYITQLACYHHCLDTDGAFLLCYNKNSHEYRIVWLSPERMNILYTRAVGVISSLSTIKTLDDLYNLPAPPPVPELYRGEPTGAYVPHPSVVWDEERHLIYDIKVGKRWNKPKDYVVGVYPTHQALLNQTPEPIES